MKKIMKFGIFFYAMMMLIKVNITHANNSGFIYENDIKITSELSFESINTDEAKVLEFLNPLSCEVYNPIAFDESESGTIEAYNDYPPGSEIRIRGITWSDKCYISFLRCKVIIISDEK